MPWTVLATTFMTASTVLTRSCPDLGLGCPALPPPGDRAPTVTSGSLSRSLLPGAVATPSSGSSLGRENGPRDGDHCGYERDRSGLLRRRRTARKPGEVHTVGTERSPDQRCWGCASRLRLQFDRRA